MDKFKLTRRFFLSSFLAVAAVTVEAADEKPILIRELPVPKLPEAVGGPYKPTVIKTAEELHKVFGEKTELKIDFEKEYLLVFRWAGSGQDKLTGSVVEEKAATVALFDYQRGLTRDLRQHAKLFAIAKKVEWRIKGKE